MSSDDWEINEIDEPSAACKNTSSMNSWFRWNLVSASVLVEIISFSESPTSARATERRCRGRTYLFVLICVHTWPLLEGERFSVIVFMTHNEDKTHSIHAASRSLFPLLSVTPLERFHLSVLLSQHRLCRRRTWVSHSNLLGYALWSRWLKLCVAWVRGVLVVGNPLHRARSRARVWWKLLRTGSTWSTRHATSHATWHTTWHTAGNSTWDVTLHAGRDPPRYTTRNVPDRRATRCAVHNLLSGLFSSDVHRRKVGGLERI